MSALPTFVVHDLGQALAACAAAAAAGRRVRLLTPPHGLTAHGPGYWAAVARQLPADARAELWVDAADAPGLAMAALRSGLARQIYSGTEETAAKLEAILAAAGGRLERARPAAQDLGAAGDPAGAVAAALAARDRAPAEPR